MNVLFQATKKFEKDLQDLPGDDAQLVISHLNRNCSLLKQDQAAFYRTVNKPMAVQLKEGMDSTLYSMSVGHDLRILLAVDEDPLFDQTIFTLLRLVRHKDLSKAYKGIAESLYQSTLISCSDGGTCGEI
jgi:mRNA-degrading endonuclease RelE of RelBE toxin-antitoxin system